MKLEHCNPMIRKENINLEKRIGCWVGLVFVLMPQRENFIESEYVCFGAMQPQ